MRLKDWSYIGATGTNVGIWMVRDNHEGGSGGAFYRSLLNQCGSDQEITYIVNYGEAQTEAYRLGILNSYTLVFTNGATPSTALDTSWFANMSLNGYLGSSGRGRVTGVGISGRDTNYAYTVGFANSTAQYYADARASDGYFNCTGMRPGTYTLTVYKGELAVHTRSVTVTAGGTLALNTIAITGDPSSVTPLWRVGNWDGTPNEGAGHVCSGHIFRHQLSGLPVEGNQRDPEHTVFPHFIPDSKSHGPRRHHSRLRKWQTEAGGEFVDFLESFRVYPARHQDPYSRHLSRQ
jgi:rhamnogalacturonan endolyase